MASHPTVATVTPLGHEARRTLRVADARRWDVYPVARMRASDGSLRFERSPGGGTLEELVALLRPDGVIVANATEKRFPDQELDARLLYVCLTRPLHRVACLYEKQLTPLLSEE